MIGKQIECARCAGNGLISTWSFGVKEPDECADCGGSGLNWLYPSGAIARYYSGPLIGRETAIATEARRAATTGAVHEGAGLQGIAQKGSSHDPR